MTKAKKESRKYRVTMFAGAVIIVALAITLSLQGYSIYKEMPINLTTQILGLVGSLVTVFSVYSGLNVKQKAIIGPPIIGGIAEEFLDSSGK